MTTPKASSRRNGPAFPIVVVWVALVAALGSGLCAALSLQPWLLFLGWCAFSTGGGSAKGGAQAIACVVLGLILGMLGATLLQNITNLGPMALIIVVFIVTAVAMLSLLAPPVNSVVGYFLGMTAYFASGLAPGGQAFLQLAIPAVFGGFCGWFAAHVSARIQQRL